MRGSSLPQLRGRLPHKVPKGWDKLFVSLVSVETGKTVAKSGKISVRTGTCCWTETFCESIFISQENDDAKELGGCFFKFVVAMGSSRSGILGEVPIDLANFASTRTSIPLSFQLKKCQYGTSLQFRVQCLTPKTKYRDAPIKEADMDIEYGISDQDDIETKSDASDGAFSRSIGSTSSSHLESGSLFQAALSRDPSFSASDSRHSSDSLETSSLKDVFSSQNNIPGVVKIGRQDSTDSQTSRPSCSFGAVNDGNRSFSSSFDSRVPEALSPYGNKKEQNSNAIASSTISNTGSTKELLEAAEVTIEELRAEVRMWERNSKKLTADVDLLKNEVSEQSRSQRTLSMELSASQLECHSYQQEIEHLNGLLEKSAKKEETTEDTQIRATDIFDMKKQMEEEIHFLKDSNANLAEQLEKTQESNIELLSILQELEGIVETQKSEIENLSSQKLKLEASVKLGNSKDLEFLDSNMNITEVTQPMQDPDEQIPVNIGSIKLQLQQLQDTQEELESAIHLLQKTVEEKDNEIERLQDLKAQDVLYSDSTWSLKLDAKEKEIMNLEAKLAATDKNCQNKVLEVAMENETEMVKEIESLRKKVEDLEKDCDELTEENLKLILKLKESDPAEPEKDMSSPDVLLSSSHVIPDGGSPCLCGSELTYLRVQLQDLKQELRRKEALIEGGASSAKTQVQYPDMENQCDGPEIQLETFKKKVIHLEDELQKCVANGTMTADVHLAVECVKEDGTEEQRDQELGDLKRCAICDCSQGPDKSGTAGYSDLTKFDFSALEVEALKSDNLQKEEYINALLEKISMHEDQIATAHNERHLLVESIESLEREKATAAERVVELTKEIIDLSTSMESHVSASKVLQRLASELEKGKQDVEQQLSEFEKENMQMSGRISVLEAQLRYLTNEKETCYLELRYSESQLVNLRDEIRQQETEMEAQKDDLKQRLEEMRTRWLEAQEECEYLEKANTKLQSTAENIIEECNSLQKVNGELKRRSMEMHTRCTVLESQLVDSKGKFSECSQKIEALEAEFCNILEEVSLKERGINSELDSLMFEDKEHKEKLMHEHLSLNDMYSQKVFEVENLQRELAHLIDQISVAHDDETLSSDSILELSVLLADKAKLEASLLELQGQFGVCQMKLSAISSESEAKMQELTRELTASRRNEEVLMADCDKLSVLLESVKSNAEKYKSIISRLEINLKACEYERELSDKEITTLKEQIQRATLLQTELLVAKSSLTDAKFEHDRMEASLEMVRGDYEELKTEKDFLVQKVFNMEKALLELENCRRSEISLQEKVLRLEGDLAAREALCAQDAELKFELSRIRRVNNELQRKIKHLEQDQEGFLDRIHALEERLKQNTETTLDLVKSAGNLSELDDTAVAVVSSTRDEETLIRITGSDSTDDLWKIQSLENQLAEALEANDMYKAQLQRFLSEEQNNSCDTLKTSGVDNRSDVKTRDSNVSSLELELRDLRERYFEMSLKYAEVEAQREELVLKLKSTNNKRSWFSK
ncbi:hypothetical protein RND81_09G000300 [Saponaria officinalis]|uniref:C2 NT-type domain-containing protein n=1 Tax=Saponaria officinalis TaxID=3572 RepID=A0AAW1IH22_SAPOF